MTVEYAVDLIIKAMYMKRNNVTIGAPMYYFLPRLCFLSETITNFVGVRNMQIQDEV